LGSTSADALRSVGPVGLEAGGVAVGGIFGPSDPAEHASSGTSTFAVEDGVSSDLFDNSGATTVVVGATEGRLNPAADLHSKAKYSISLPQHYCFTV